MAKVNPKTRVSKHFELKRDQTTLDFVDVPIGNDITVFLDPSRIRSMQTKWASECSSLLQHFFERLLEHIRTNDRNAGLYMLAGLHERNEFHLGFSSGRSQGSGIGRKFAEKFWEALSTSKAGQTGLLKDIKDACLYRWRWPRSNFRCNLQHSAGTFNTLHLRYVPVLQHTHSTWR